MSKCASLEASCLVKLAKAQRLSLIVLALPIVAFLLFLSGVGYFVASLVSQDVFVAAGMVSVFVLLVLQLYAVFKMAQYSREISVFYIILIGLLFPPIAAIGFLYLHNKVNKILRRAGYSLGIFGARL